MPHFTNKHPEPRVPRFVGAMDRLGNLMNEQPEHLTKTEARAGTTPHMTRYVLGVGLVLVIVIFSVILFVAR